MAWTPLAETVHTLAKGDHIIVEGELRTGRYERELQVNGGDIVTVTTKTWEIRARAIRKLEAKPKATQPEAAAGSTATPAPSSGAGVFFA